jgi:glycogen debranching enzyme
MTPGCAWQRFTTNSTTNALRKKAEVLFRKFNEAFWDEKSGFYAYALDGEKKKVLSVVSNVGQCLWSGIIAPERAGKVAKRLMREDMWSGWGIRTLSADHPSFNPYNYQTGRSGRTTTR